jgi:hypothetical protein
MPGVIGNCHDGFIKKYFTHGKLNLEETMKQSFAQNKDCFIFRVDIMIKIYPKINGNI